MKQIILFCTALLMAFNTLAQTEKHISLHVNEMTCQLCAYMVNKTLRNVEGVISTKANIKDKIVNITALDSLPNKTLIDAVEKIHYTAEIIE